MYTFDWDFVPLLNYMEMMKLWFREMKKFAKGHTASKAQNQDSKQVIPTPCFFSVWGKRNKYFKYIELDLPTWYLFGIHNR